MSPDLRLLSQLSPQPVKGLAKLLIGFCAFNSNTRARLLDTDAVKKMADDQVTLHIREVVDNFHHFGRLEALRCPWFRCQVLDHFRCQRDGRLFDPVPAQ